MFAYPKCRAMTAGCLLGLMASAAQAGDPPVCSVPPIPLYTTFEVWLDTPGPPTACVRDFFPAPPGIRQGWTTEEGGFGQSNPSDPSSWNALSGLVLAVESCYGPNGPMPTYPNFPPGTCGLFEYPRIEGEYETFNRQWVMKWYLSCGNPSVGTYEVRFDLYREDYCPDGEPPIMVDGFEQ